MNVKEMIAKMSLEQKARMVSGQDFWRTEDIEELGIQHILVSDGPHGVRKQEKKKDGNGFERAIEAVCFPAACATASSFNRELMGEMGHTLGKECQAEELAVLLGPAVNIKRSPLCGRNFEYVSEDPYVTGELSAAYINGVQAEGVGTSIKHFAVNSSEFERMYIDEVVDERTLREIYLAGFETAVKKSQPWTVMASYNRVNGTYSSENPWLLTKVLRDEWGFEGLVMSDWAAVSDRIKGIAAGLDLEMPGSNGVNDAYIVEAVKNGTLAEADLNKAVENVLILVEKFFTNHKDGFVFDRVADHKKAAEVGKECVVLLQNKNKTLPLAKDEKVLFVGGFAETPRFQGGGSSHIHAHKIVSALDAVKEADFADEANVSFVPVFPYDADAIDEKELGLAIEKAADADKIVVFAGLPDSFESEGYDREHMKLPETQNRTIEALVKTGKPIVVVLHNGSPVELPWAEDVDAIVEAYLGGEVVGETTVSVLYGDTNPSGKLAESFPIKLEDNPSYLNFPGNMHKCEFKEGVFVGYRYYDTKKMDVRFPFGHGLSYTTFEYSNLVVAPEFTREGGLRVSVDVTNTGDVFGKEVVQFYVADKTGVAVRPVHELKGFEKVALNPGETKTVTVTLDERAFAWYDVDSADWFAGKGTYEIQVAASSRDIRLTKETVLTDGKVRYPKIDADVQIGELRKFPELKVVIDEMLKKELSFFAPTDSESDLMLEAMMRFMPIRALRSFTFLTNEKVAEIVKALKEVAGQ